MSTKDDMLAEALKSFTVSVSTSTKEDVDAIVPEINEMARNASLQTHKEMRDFEMSILVAAQLKKAALNK